MRRRMIVLLLGRILDLDRFQAGLGDPQRIGRVILGSPPDRQVVGSAELLQEISFKSLSTTFFAALPLRFAGRIAAWSARCEAEDRIIN